MIRWHSVEGKQYRVHRSTHLVDGFVTVASNLVATPSENTYTDVVETVEAVFYRIAVE